MIKTEIKPRVHEMKEAIADHLDANKHNVICSHNTKQKLRENKL